MHRNNRRISTVPDWLTSLLQRASVDYRVLSSTSFRAAQTAMGSPIARTMLLKVGFGYAMLVAPESRLVSPQAIAEAIGVARVERALDLHLAERNMLTAPPFGGHYGLPLFAALELSKNERISFYAGSYDTVVQMKWADYRRLAPARLIDLSDTPRRDRQPDPNVPSWRHRREPALWSCANA
jgi:prolyl-tRNA editing enzyme YbaK/EbsC (Cys-tRNA(Pro) deacylase)